MPISRRQIIYAAIFSVASYAVAAGLALGIGAYAFSIFTDPIVTLTIPLIIVSVGIQAINSRYGPLLILAISAVLYGASGLIFLLPTLIIAGLVVEGVSRIIGYRGFRAVLINTTLAGGLTGFFSVVFGVLMIPSSLSTFTYTGLAVFSAIYFVESAIMGIISYYIGSFLIRSGILR